MHHYFNVDIAKEYGINAAVLLENIGYWVKLNEANETNFFDGNYWTYNSRRAYQELFPYMSKRQVDTAFEKLINAGLIITGNYNKLAYDRTLWYALTQKGKSILHFGVMDNPEMSNGQPRNVPPIPDINPVSKPCINPDEGGKRKRFAPPTLEEVKAYCLERNNGIDPQAFIDYYAARGWKLGKDTMKDWKAAVRTWENRRKGDSPKRGTSYTRAEPVPDWLNKNGGDLERLEQMMGINGKGADP